MTITMKQARPLCTKSELELVEWSTPKRIKDLDASRLRQKLSRARKLRDKFRDLGDSQKRQIRGKEGRAAKGGPAQDNRNTRLKQQLFAETIERFEKALDKAEAKSAKAATKKTTKKTKKKTGKKVAKKVSKKTGTAASTTATKKAAKKTAKKSGKKVAKKASKKVAKQSGDAASQPAAKKAGKKTGKKTAPKTATKPTMRASQLLGGSPAPQPNPLTPAKTKAIKKILATKETRQNNIALITISDEIRPKTKAMALDKGGALRFQGHVSARGRRTQAKRDAR